jgi:hypothetical protein
MIPSAEQHAEAGHAIDQTEIVDRMGRLENMNEQPDNTLKIPPLLGLPELPSLKELEKARAAQERQLQERLALAVVPKAIMTCVYQVGERRNTWGGPFVYRAQMSFITVAAAQQSVEIERKMGSAWRIRELPACAFLGAEECLAVADSDVEPIIPLHANNYVSGCRPYLASLRTAFKQPFKTRLRLLAPPGEVTGIHSFRQWSSETFGGRYRLHWTRGEREEHFDVSAVKSILENHAHSLRSCAFWGIVPEGFAGGTLIKRMHSQSPLALKGIRVGDAIKAVGNSTQQTSGLSLSAAISAARPGDVVTLFAQRDAGHDAGLEVTLELPSFENVFS